MGIMKLGLLASLASLGVATAAPPPPVSAQVLQSQLNAAILGGAASFTIPAGRIGQRISAANPFLSRSRPRALRAVRTERCRHTTGKRSIPSNMIFTEIFLTGHGVVVLLIPLALLFC